MSCIYFHSEDREAVVRGRERAHCGLVCGDIALALLSLRRFGNDPLVALLPGDAVCPPDPFPTTRFVIGELQFALPDGRRVDAFTVALNSVLAVGDDALRFMARLHGQCEIHGYVEGPHRAWLAEIVERGLSDHLLRPRMGWDGVVALLRTADDKPVVTSYSVCESFPNPTIAGVTDDRAREEWYDLPGAERWRQALRGLRAHAGGLEWTPDDWRVMRFDDGTTAMDLRAIADALAEKGKG